MRFDKMSLSLWVSLHIYGRLRMNLLRGTVCVQFAFSDRLKGPHRNGITKGGTFSGPAGGVGFAGYCGNFLVKSIRHVLCKTSSRGSNTTQQTV